MKISVVKIVLLVPYLLFMDLVIMIFLGSISNMCGADDHFFCTIYCNFGIALLISTLIFLVYMTISPYFHHHQKNHVKP